MEIHQRRPASAATPSENDSTVRDKRRTAPLLRRPRDPRSSAATTADVVIVRVIQVLVLVAAAWFAYLAVVINSDLPSSSSEATAKTTNGGRGLHTDADATNNAAIDPQSLAAARDSILQIRNEFYERYGGKDSSTAMLKRGLRTFDDGNAGGGSSGGLNRTADRYLRSIVRHEEDASPTSSAPARFVMAFGGYSVTVGRGNHFSQSFPFVMERILGPLLSKPPLNIELVVRNSAIGGIPSFPYGWCLPNFLGGDADSVSWDYGMNEGNGAAGLESYVRHSLMLHHNRGHTRSVGENGDVHDPLFVLLDMKRDRIKLLQKYVELGYLSDPIALGNREAVDKALLALPEDRRPPGLQKWDEWGAPPGSPGQSPWHPKKMEHELMGWMMAMRMVDAVEVALDVMEGDPDWRARFRSTNDVPGGGGGRGGEEVILPPPVTDVSNTGVASMLHGAPLDDAHVKKDGLWHMHPVSCRTSFLPNVSGRLVSIISSGVAPDPEVDNMLKERDPELFSKGWVMDVGKVERETKAKVENKGGLGYIDMKTALYGVPSSGTIKFHLPLEGKHPEKYTSNGGGVNESEASEYIAAIIVCEVNEKRTNKECDLTSDLSFKVGGTEVSKGDVQRIKGAASYLKKDICIRVGVPKGARLSTTATTFEYGLDLEVTVVGKEVSRENGACSISHVIWENQ